MQFSIPNRTKEYVQFQEDFHLLSTVWMWNQLNDSACQQKPALNAGTVETDANMGLTVINKLIKKESMEQRW